MNDKAGTRLAWTFSEPDPPPLITWWRRQGEREWHRLEPGEAAEAPTGSVIEWKAGYDDAPPIGVITTHMQQPDS